MKYFLLVILVIFLFSSVLSAQFTIEDPVYGTVVQKKKVLSTAGGKTIVESTKYSTATGVFGVANTNNSTTTVNGANRIFYNLANGIVEFDLNTFTIPDSMTSQNFTARLLGLNGEINDTDSATASDVNIDLYELAKDQQDGNITKDDFNAISGDAVSEGPFVNGDFPAEGIDITDQLRESLYGIGQDGFTGFILIPGDSDDGIVSFQDSDMEGVKIKITLNSDDTDTLDSDDTDTLDSDDTDTLDSDDTDTLDSDDTDTLDSDDTDDWDTDDTDFDSDSDSEDNEITDPDVTCSCNIAGYRSVNNIFKILFDNF